MSNEIPPGWYAPDPQCPTKLRWWDGSAWTQTSADADPATVGAAVAGAVEPNANAKSAGAPMDLRTMPEAIQGRRRPWITSWPIIALGFVLCFIPGLVLLWVRPGTSAKVKSGVTAATVGLLVILALVAPGATPTASAPSNLDSRSPTPSAEATTPNPNSSSTSVPVETTAATSTQRPSSGSPSASALPSTGVTGTASSALLALPVKGRAPKTGYSRAQFGNGWVDVNRNGCDTRNDMLIATLTNINMSGTCKVLQGTLADPYTGRSIRFVYGGVSEVDIDHVVALSDAWQKGAATWPFAKRVALANDPLNLQPTDSSANRQKGDGDAATWLPPSKSYRCTYVARQIAVKKKYGLWVTAAEKQAMQTVLATCPGKSLPSPGTQPVIAANTGGQAPSSIVATPSKKAGLDPDMGTCKAAKAAGYGPYYRGVNPEYYYYRDADGDGKVCE
ncbi:MAG: DUF1524 domain-containing protein [Actinomycetes bacterium]